MEKTTKTTITVSADEMMVLGKFFEMLVDDEDEFDASLLVGGAIWDLYKEWDGYNEVTITR